MNFTFEIAKRYLLGRKSTSAINIISWISVIGMTIGTAALILILSVFNGFESLLAGLTSAFNPDLKVEPIKGKFFEVSDDQAKQLRDIEGLIQFTKTVEEVCLFEYKNVQIPGRIKGVDENYAQVTSIDSAMVRGKFVLLHRNRNYGAIGKGLSANLTINRKDAITPLKVHVPTRSAKGVMGKMGKEFLTVDVYPSGTFAVGNETDVRYTITNMEAVNSLLDQENKISALEIKLSEDADEEVVRMGIASVLGDGFKVKNRYEQEEAFLKVMNIEKWVSYLIVMLTLGIIAFNMIGSIWMMVLEKKKDISILRSMGYETKHIRRIFLLEGLIITGVGIIIGIALALILYFLQKEFGIISIPDGFMINAYPIELKWTDFVLVIFTVFVIGWGASLIPSYRAGHISAFVRQEMQ